MKEPPLRASLVSAQSSMACPRSERNSRAVRTGMRRPMPKAMRSPVSAPAAAMRKISHSGTVWACTASAASAMTIDSLGIGGKKPSMVQKA